MKYLGKNIFLTKYFYEVSWQKYSAYISLFKMKLKEMQNITSSLF